jgi:hypothetical protein
MHAEHNQLKLIPVKEGLRDLEGALEGDRPRKIEDGREENRTRAAVLKTIVP